MTEISIKNELGTAQHALGGPPPTTWTAADFAHRTTDPSPPEMITRLGTKVGDCDEMRLRSGHRVGVDGPAARVPQTAAEARAMLLKETVRMPDNNAGAFKEGLAGLLNRWTALQLAITNEWGGAESVQKGEAMREELEDLRGGERRRGGVIDLQQRWEKAIEGENRRGRGEREPPPATKVGEGDGRREQARGR